VHSSCSPRLKNSSCLAAACTLLICCVAVHDRMTHCCAALARYIQNTQNSCPAEDRAFAGHTACRTCECPQQLTVGAARPAAGTPGSTTHSSSTNSSYCCHWHIKPKCRVLVPVGLQ
jgi:hypothetical protein